MQWGSARLTAAAALMFTLYADAPANINNDLRRASLYCWAQVLVASCTQAQQCLSFNNCITHPQGQMRQLLGDAGRSYVVGFGVNPPQRPHHRGASCPNLPAPCGQAQFNSPGPNPQILYGALVGGPSLDGSYQDVRSDYVRNEVTIDYNAAFTGAEMDVLLYRHACIRALYHARPLIQERLLASSSAVPLGQTPATAC